jgi:hypothetical protein
MITINSFTFSIPGMIFGIMIAFVLNIFIREMVFKMSYNASTYELAASAIIIGVLFGILMPLFANYYPIKQAMGKTLRDSLDLSKRTQDQFGVKIQKLEDVGMSFNQLVVAILLTAVGFISYYAIPLCFIKGKTTLMLIILNLILIMLIIGCTFICTLLYNLLEKSLLWITLHTCCRKDKKFYQLILKNMHGHQKRNQKTSIMFTLAISFMVFSCCSFSIITDLSEKLTL